MIEKKDIGLTLSELRKIKGYSQAEIAKMFNVSDSSVSKWESGQCDVDINYLDGFAKLYNVSIDEICSYQDVKRAEAKKQEEELQKRILEKNNLIQKQLKTGSALIIKAWDKNLGFHGKDSRIQTHYEDGKLVVYQKEDPSIIVYDSCLTIRSIECKVHCSSFIQGQWIECSHFENNDNSWNVVFNFDDPTTQIKLSFEEEGIEDFVINVEYIRADRAAFLAKTAAKEREELIRRMAIRVFRDTNNASRPVNVVFHPAKNTFAYAVIELYMHVDINFYVDEWQDPRVERYVDLLKRYRLPDGDLIWINLDLCSNCYEFVLKQFDKDDNLIIESDLLKL